MKLFPMLIKMIELKRNEKLNREEFEKKRQKKFIKLVKYVNAHSSFYADVIRNNKIDINNCRPEDFPVITKSEVMKNFDRIVTCKDITKAGISGFLEESEHYSQLYKDKYHVLHTSGSSGEVGYFVYSEADWARGCTQLFRMNKRESRKLKFAFYGVDTGHYAGISTASAGEKIGGRTNYIFKSFNVQAPLASVVQELNAYQPDYLIGYASGVKLLAEEQNKGNLNISLMNVSCSSEPLTTKDRQLMETTFNAPVMNLYASTEFLVMGVGRKDYQGLVLLDDDLIFELHEEYTCVTSLFNRTMPLIRYKMRDVLIPQDGISQFPPYMQIEELVGRMEQSPVFKNKNGVEESIPPSVIMTLYVNDLRRFQFHITGKTSFRFDVCLEKRTTEDQRLVALQNIERKLTQILSERDMDNVIFEIKELDDIHADPKTGKFKVIVENEDL